MMADALNFHTHYPDLTRYWSAISEKFAGADCLLTALQRDYEFDHTVYVEEFWHAGTRPVLVYHFTLTCKDDSFVMPVINTPYVRRLIYFLNLTCRPLSDRTNRRSTERDAV
jgi:hypothetical protein